MTAYVNVADFKLGCQKVGLLLPLLLQSACRCVPEHAHLTFNSTLGSGRLFVDSHHDLRHLLAWSLPALLKEITVHPLGTVGQKVHRAPAVLRLTGAKALLSTLWMQDPRC